MTCHDVDNIAGCRARSGGLAVVVLEDSAQPLAAADGRERNGFVGLRRLLSPARLGRREQIVVLVLMRPFAEVVRGVFGDQVVEMTLSKDHEMIEALGMRWTG